MKTKDLLYFLKESNDEIVSFCDAIRGSLRAKVMIRAVRGSAGSWLAAASLGFG